MKRAAFTLIELLVVLAIIALLMGLLLPTLGAARAAGRAALCLSHVRQSGMAWTAYATDNDGAVMPYAAVRPGVVRYWFGSSPSGASGLARPLDPAGGFLAPHLGGGIDDALACPAFPAGHADFRAKFAVRSAHHGYNGALRLPFAPYGRGVASVLRITRPSDTFVFVDAVHQDFSDTLFYEPHTVAFRRAGAVTGVPQFRHGDDAANLVAADGHARAVGPAAVVGRVAGLPVGNLDTDDGPGTWYGFRTWTY